MKQIQDLSALAQRLRLTKRQRAFAEALAADPDRNQTRAAIAAGAASKHAVCTASRWSRMVKIRQYLAALSGEAVEGARTAVLKRRAVLRLLSAQALGAVPSRRVVRTGADGRTGGIVEEFNSQAAAVRLLDHAEWRAEEEDTQIAYWIEALRAVPAAELAASGPCQSP